MKRIGAVTGTCVLVMAVFLCAGCGSNQAKTAATTPDISFKFSMPRVTVPQAGPAATTDRSSSESSSSESETGSTTAQPSHVLPPEVTAPTAAASSPSPASEPVTPEPCPS